MNYYEILGVGAEASAEQIKRSFRRLAHKYHPDHNHGHPAWAGNKLRQALEAYGVVGDPIKRVAYDRRLWLEEGKTRDRYRERLFREKDAPRSRAKLILHDLMADRPDQALRWFEEGILDNGGFDLSKYLPARDWLDCTVLLAEEYERRGRHELALDLYEEVYDSGGARERYGAFFFEVRDRIRNLCCRVLAKGSPGEEAVGYYARALNLELPKSQEAYILKKMAERYYEINRPGKALDSLQAAFELNPNMKGARRICQKLAFSPALPQQGP